MYNAGLMKMCKTLECLRFRRMRLKAYFVTVLKVSALSGLGNVSHGDNGCGGCSNWSENFRF